MTTNRIESQHGGESTSSITLSQANNPLQTAVDKYCPKSLNQNFHDEGILHGNLFVLEALDEDGDQSQQVIQPEFNERWIVLTKDGVIRLYDDEEEYQQNSSDPVLQVPACAIESIVTDLHLETLNIIHPDEEGVFENKFALKLKKDFIFLFIDQQENGQPLYTNYGVPEYQIRQI